MHFEGIFNDCNTGVSMPAGMRANYIRIAGVVIYCLVKLFIFVKLTHYYIDLYTYYNKRSFNLY